MLSKIKAWLITAGAFTLVILASGGYARYQKRRAEKAEDEAEENKLQLEQSEQINLREITSQEQNNESQTNAIERISRRKYFGLRDKE